MTKTKATKEDIIKIQKAHALHSMRLTPGYQVLHTEIVRRRDEGWDKTLSLSASSLEKRQFWYAKAKYDAHKELLEWIEEEVKDGFDLERHTE